jgi:vancomycin resistance protein YoaR
MRKYLIAAAIIPALLLVGAAYAYQEADSAAGTSIETSLAEAEVTELTNAQVAAIAAGYEATYAANPVVIIVDGTSVEIDPADAGITVDQPALAEQANAMIGDPHGATDAVRWLIALAAGELIDMPIPVTVDDAALTRMLEEASLTAIDTPAIDGAVEIVNGRVTPQYPVEGLRIDIEAAIPLVTDQILSLERTPIDVPVTTAQPQITRDDVDAAVAQAARMVQSDIILRAARSDGEIVFSAADLKKALRSEIIQTPKPAIQVFLDRDTLTKIAGAYADDFNTAPVNATFGFSRAVNNLVVVPSIPGQSLDVEAAVDLVLAKAAGGLRSGIIPTIDGVEADYTTEDAQALGPFGKVSSFTTRHPCCQNRVVNIQKIARAANGAIVMPGQTFSLNARAGQRTEAKGYVRAGAIIGGKVQCCDSIVNVGGGTSQFATTLWNAIFFGCYQDVFHQPHSLYFSRYPYVREATLGWPSPDVKFRNDSAAPVYLQATYTSTSITVTLFGNNGGRTCTSSTSGNTVTRTMKWPNGNVTRQHWTWNYRQPAKDEPTTTTTHAPSTTTTTKPSTPTTTQGGTSTTVTTQPPATTTTVPPPPTTTQPPATTTTQAPTTTQPPATTTTTAAP